MSTRRVSTRTSVGGRDTRKAGYVDVWQDQAIAKFRGERRWALSGPTGAGKSVVQRTMAALYPGKSFLLAPQGMILEGLRKPLDLRLRDETRIEWEPSLVLIDEPGTTRQMYEWLRGSQRGTCVASTLAFIALFNLLKEKGELYRLKNTFSSFDEGHHIEDGNRSGEVLGWLFENQSHIGVSTATWTRSNLNEILPHREAWTWYRYPMYRYLANLRYLRDITVGFIIGSPEEALEETLLLEEMVPTIMHLPAPGSRHGVGTKMEQLERLLGICGPWVEDGPFRLHRRRIEKALRRIRTSDLVTLEGRDGFEGRKRQHMERLLQGPRPDITFALNLALEGYDDPPLARGLLIGARDSSITRLHAFGRLLRDVKGKTAASFNIIAPPLTDPRESRTYLRDIIATLADLDWRIRPSRVNYDVRPETDPDELDPEPEETLDDEEVDFDPTRAVKDILDEQIRNPKLSPSDLQLIATNVVRDQGVRNPEALAEELLRRKRIIEQSVSSTVIRGEFPVQARASEEGLARLFVALTPATLLQVRAANGYDLDLTIEEIRTAVRRYYEETGRWPSRNTKAPVPGIENLTWFQMHGAACERASSLDLVVDDLREQLVGYPISV